MALAFHGVVPAATDSALPEDARLNPKPKPVQAAFTAHFTASYFNGPGGHFTVAGERIQKTRPKAFTKDSETILITDLLTWPPGVYVMVDGLLMLPSGPTPWLSDYDYFVLGQERFAISGIWIVTDNGDTTGTLEVEAYF